MPAARFKLVSLCLVSYLVLSTLDPAIAAAQTAPPRPAAEDPGAPESPPSALAEALGELELDNLDAAIAILERAQSDGESDPRLGALLGAIYVETDRHAEALAVLTPLAEADNADIAVLYNAGRAAIGVEDFERAQRYLEASVAAFPASPAARELGLLHIRQGRFMAAYLLLRPWSRSHPSDAEATTAAARCAVALGRGAEAEQLLQQLPNPEPAVKLLWANALLLKGDAWSALAVAKELSQNPSEALEPQVLMLLADVYLELEQADLVVETLTGKTERRPQVAVRLASALRQQGQSEQGLALLRPFSRGLIENDPEIGRWRSGLGAEVALEYGRLLAAAGRSAEAVAFLRTSTELSPQDPDAWRALAAALDETGDPPAARAAEAEADRFERLAGSAAAEDSGHGVNLGSDPTARQLRRARAMVALGAVEEGLRVARQEAVLVPEDPRSRLVEAQLLMGLARRDEALAVLDAALGSFQANADVHYYRGVVQLSLDRLEPAERSLNRALELVPQHVPALTDLAHVLIKLDRGDEAGELLRQVLTLVPEDPTASALLERLGLP